MAIDIIEGTWEEIKQHDAELAVRRFRLIPLAATPDDPDFVTLPRKMITEGMFPQLAGVTEEDFISAEFHGDPDDVVYG